jgi:hypothetical protein
VKLYVILSSSLFIQLSEAGVLSASHKTDKTEYRAVIKFFVKEGLTPNEINPKFIRVYADILLYFQLLRNGLPSLNVALRSLEDDPR